MDGIADEIRALVLERLGAEAERVEVLAGALGRRRFARVHLADPDAVGAATLIARVDTEEDPQRRPAGVAPEPPLEPIRALLERAGLPVPRRYAGSDRAELLEDFGDAALADVAPSAAPAERARLYAQACALVPRIQRVGPAPGVAAFERRLDAAQLAYKAERFARWSLRADPAATGEVRRAFARIAQIALAAPQRLAHRDFQSANLIVAGDRIAMIDLQGALLAPPEYDLVCLLRDSYVELDDAFVAQRIADVREQLPDAPDAETFAHRFDLLTLSRKAKDHALYLYAAAELGDGRYLRFAPAARRALQAAAVRVASRDPSFAALAEMIAALPEDPCAR